MMARMTAGEMLTLPELRALRATSDLRGAALVAHAWLVIAGAMVTAALWPSPPVLAAAALVIGGRQLGLAVLMHEASHWLLFRGQRANNRVGTWLSAAPIWADLPSYRRRHHLHHRHTQQPGDPDRELAVAPATRRAFWRAGARELSGWTALVAALGWRPAAGWRWVLRPLAANAVLAATLTAAGYWHFYLLLWLLPRATWYQFGLRIRHLAEHGVVSDDADALRNARTTESGLLARAFLAPYWVNHHLEHHLLVFVPCWRLPDAHALLGARGHGARMEVAPGYVDVLRRAMAAGAR
jgi:fatty acid desaturase